ncbi:hypothetical protein VOLCADRAFT_86362 [Volvox carteri f. nagariensis]|uniref:Uncharacterized protein mot4 n=1 Tax=Volvox carteri f. nagariensis TaxID=3068 RepID=D8TIK4_VOLCA|nr:uncharacterized protein VOLCADRAFT_86362 [Volvox carteri f. nagariensis]EFJ52902.1 hypothetical protein VOLCADRAFT_86362 [Volvox carteri f. nagariensis]|eukprot:XP_002945907.1 hypothetical protein VOLCADRAFT_86362 [Volvox carteri f. nagariensis]
MAERVSPWRPKPSQEVVDLLHQLSPVGANGTCKELCMHTVFVMVKVLRVPVSNPLLWQLSLSDRELEEVLRCGTQPERPPQEAAKAKPAAEKTPAGQVKRRDVDEEEPCPICYEDMLGQDLDNLVWCRFGCGRNVHGKCMGVWMEHQVQSLGKELTCPLCRSEWGEFKWRPPPPKRKAREERKDVHYGTHCGACKKPSIGPGGAIAGVPTSPRHGNAAAASGAHMGQRTHSHTHLSDIAGGITSPRGGGGGSGSGDGEAHAEAEGAGQAAGEMRRASASGVAGGGGGNGSSTARDALVIGAAGQQLQQQQQHTAAAARQAGGGGGAAAAGARHPVRGTTIARAGAGPRITAEEPPSLEARLAAQRRPLLAVEGLTVGPGGAAAAQGGQAGPPHDLSDMLVRRAALGQPSRPVLVRRARSTVTHDRSTGEGSGGAGDLNLGLAGVPLNAGGERSLHGEAAGPGYVGRGLRRKPEPGPGGVQRGPGKSGGFQRHKTTSVKLQPLTSGAVAWVQGGGAPMQSGGPPAAGQPPELVLQGRVVLHGEVASPGPVGVRCRGPPPRYIPPPENQQPPGLRRTHSAGPQGPMTLAVTARSMAPHPLTPETPSPVPLPPAAHPPPAASLPGNLQGGGGGPYGPAPYGNETYGGAIQYDDNVLMAFTHHIPGPGSSFRHELEANGWLVQEERDGVWGVGSDGEDGAEEDPLEEEFPRGPPSPAQRLFSSRPNTVPSELVSDLYGEPGAMSRCLSHSHSFTLSTSGRRCSRLGLTLSRGGGASAKLRDSLEDSSSPLAPAAPPMVLSSPRTSRASARLALGSAGGGGGCVGVGDVGRDSVLLASVRMDAVDDWMDSLRRQQRLSRDGGTSTSHSCSGVPPGSSPRVLPVEESLFAASVTSSITGGAALAAIARLSVANASATGEEPSGAVQGEAAVALSASFEDTLSAFMVEQQTAINPSPSKPDRDEIDFTTYANPVFNRPYTLDMSFQ